MKLDDSKIRGDFHMHTEYSTDSSADVRSMLEASVARGLKTVCVTDHLDMDYPPDEELGDAAFQLDIETYFADLTGLKEEYGGTLDIRIGVELGLQPHLGEAYKELTESTEGVYSGVGITMTKDSDSGEIKVVNTLKGSPADGSGLKEGDVLTKIGDENVGTDADLNDVVSKVKGKEGTTSVTYNVKVYTKIGSVKEQLVFSNNVTFVAINKDGQKVPLIKEVSQSQE